MRTGRGGCHLPRERLWARGSRFCTDPSRVWSWARLGRAPGDQGRKEVFLSVFLEDWHFLLPSACALFKNQDKPGDELIQRSGWGSRLPLGWWPGLREVPPRSPHPITCHLFRGSCLRVRVSPPGPGHGLGTGHTLAEVCVLGPSMISGHGSRASFRALLWPSSGSIGTPVTASLGQVAGLLYVPCFLSLPFCAGI